MFPGETLRDELSISLQNLSLSSTRMALENFVSHSKEPDTKRKGNKEDGGWYLRGKKEMNKENAFIFRPKKLVCNSCIYLCDIQTHHRHQSPAWLRLDMIIWGIIMNSCPPRWKKGYLVVRGRCALEGACWLMGFSVMWTPPALLRNGGKSQILLLTRTQSKVRQLLKSGLSLMLCILP